MSLDKLNQVLKGGAGSGHHGHAGRPGKRGGGAPSGGGSSGGMQSPETQMYAEVFGIPVSEMQPRNAADPRLLPTPDKISKTVLNTAYKPDVKSGGKVRDMLKVMERVGDNKAINKLQVDFNDVMKSPQSMKPAHAEILREFGY